MPVANHFTSLHPIDLDASAIVPAPVSERRYLDEYVNDLIGNAIDGRDQRAYAFDRQTTEVHQALRQMAGQPNCDAHAQTIADRLFSTEKAVQQRIQHLSKVQRGSLIQVVFNNDGADMVLLAKVDSFSFLDDEDFRKHSGLPYEKRVLKTCLARFENGAVQSAWISDSNETAYWWDEFLEMKPVRDDMLNTKNAFYAIDNAFGQIRKKHPADYSFLRNNLVGYFSTQRQFSMQSFTNHVFGNYAPADPQFNIEALKAKVLTLPSSSEFDTAFSIEIDDIKSRFKRTIELTPKIKLEISGEVDNLGNTIEGCEIEGQKGVFIHSEAGYSQFHRA